MLKYYFVFLGKSESQLDIAFIVGAREPQAIQVFNFEKDIAKKIIDLEQPIETRYSLITYGSQADTQLSFDDFRDKARMKLFIDFIQWSQDSVALDDALEKALVLFNESSPHHSRKVLFVFVNAKTDALKERLEANSKKLLSIGVNVLVIRIGDNIDNGEITRIVSQAGNVMRITLTGSSETVVDRIFKILATDPCAALDCRYYGICVADQQGYPNCRCPEAYPKLYNPVCGSDLKTYSNLEALKVAACKAQKDITLRAPGKCGMFLSS